MGIQVLGEALWGRPRTISALFLNLGSAYTWTFASLLFELHTQLNIFFRLCFSIKKKVKFRLLSPDLLKCRLLGPSSLKCRFSFRRSKSGPEICMLTSSPGDFWCFCHLKLLQVGASKSWCDTSWVLRSQMPGGKESVKQPTLARLQIATPLPLKSLSSLYTKF